MTSVAVNGLIVGVGIVLTWTSLALNTGLGIAPGTFATVAPGLAVATALLWAALGVTMQE